MTTASDLAALNAALAKAASAAATAEAQVAAGTPSSWASIAAMFAIANAQTAAAALGADITPAPTPNPPPAPVTTTALVGIYDNGTPVSTLGINPAIILDYADGTNSTTYGYNSQRTNQQKGRRLMLSVGVLTSSQATAIAETLVSAGQSNAIIRPMWEMNQAVNGWFNTWNQNALTAAQYKTTWGIIHAAFMAVNASFQFCWCQNAGDGNNAKGRTSTDTFPGAQVCDYIGVDIYDGAGSVANSQSQLTEVVNFAKSVGLPWCAPEWGLYNNVDDPAFITMMQTNSSDGTCFMQSLFSEVGLMTGAGTDITMAPKSLAAYKAWCG